MIWYGCPQWAPVRRIKGDAEMVAEPPRIDVLSVGVDWITATAPADGRDMALLLSAEGALEDERRAGHEEERRRWQRYDLRTAGGVSCGVREDGAIVRLSGESAHVHWRTVAKRAVNISRLDCEVTVCPYPPDPKLAARTLGHFARWRKGRPNAPKLGFHGSPDGIETLYVGSRASDLFGRLYDKHKESGGDDWAACWRYEVECKGDLARRLARVLAAEHDPGRAARVFVHDYFSRRGCRPVFERGAGDVRVSCHRPVTDDMTRLKWLAESVQPVVLRLADKGQGQEVVRALGLARDGEYIGRPDWWSREE